MAYGKIKYKGYIAPCKLCGKPGYIIDDGDGIGDVGCWDINCPNNRGEHYSGKFCTSKKEAVRKWNEKNKLY